MGVERTRLARWLWDHDITQLRLCELSGVSRQTVSNAYLGRRVSLDVWVRLANGLNVSVADIAPAEDAARIASVA